MSMLKVVENANAWADSLLSSKDIIWPDGPYIEALRTVLRECIVISYIAGAMNRTDFDAPAPAAPPTTKSPDGK